MCIRDSPSGIFWVTGLFNAMVVNPAAVTTPVILVLDCIPAIPCNTSWPIRTSEFVVKIIDDDPWLHCAASLAKYLVSAPLTDWTANAKFWSPLKNVNEFAAPPVANLSVSITPDVISDAAIWLDDRDTQLLTLNEDVLIVLLILTAVSYTHLTLPTN